MNFYKHFKTHYIDNEQFYQALRSLKQSGLSLKQHHLGNYISKCIIAICNNIALSKNFIGYTYRDEMIDDAIENCIKYIHNFDPDRSKYAFSYFSRVAFYAFIRRIKKEKEQQYIKYKMMSDSTVLDEILSQCKAETENADMDVSNIVNSIQKMLIDSNKIQNTPTETIFKRTPIKPSNIHSLEQFL